MSFLFPDIPKSLAADERKKLVEFTFTQLNKDLIAAGFSTITIATREESIQESADELLKLLEDEINLGGHRLPQLFYRVDLDEIGLKELARKCAGAELVEELAKRIVQREFQKVVIRHSW